MDLAILIDGSQSVEYFGAGNFRKCLRFVQYLVSSFNIAREGTHVGMVVFSNTAEVVFRFEEYLSLTLVSRAIGNTKYLQGGIHIGNALDVAWNQLIDASARQDVPKVLLVMTVGASQVSLKFTYRKWALCMKLSQRNRFVLEAVTYVLPSSVADFVPCDSIMQRAHWEES